MTGRDQPLTEGNPVTGQLYGVLRTCPKCRGMAGSVERCRNCEGHGQVFRATWLVISPKGEPSHVRP